MIVPSKHFARHSKSAKCKNIFKTKVLEAQLSERKEIPLGDPKEQIDQFIHLIRKERLNIKHALTTQRAYVHRLRDILDHFVKEYPEFMVKSHLGWREVFNIKRNCLILNTTVFY